MSAGNVLMQQGIARGSDHDTLNQVAFAPDTEKRQLVSPEVAAITDLIAARDEASLSLGTAGEHHKELARIHSDKAIKTATERAADASEVDVLVRQVLELSRIVEAATTAEQIARQEKYDASDAVAAKITEKKALFAYIADSVKECDTEDVPSLLDVEAINTSLNKLAEEMLQVTTEDTQGRSELKASFVTIQKAQKLFDEKSGVHMQCSEHLARAKADLQDMLEKVATKHKELESKAKEANKESKQLGKVIGRHALREQAPSAIRSKRILGRFLLGRSTKIALEAK